MLHSTLCHLLKRKINFLLSNGSTIIITHGTQIVTQALCVLYNAGFTKFLARNPESQNTNK